MAIREQELASTTSIGLDEEVRIVNSSQNRRITVENFLISTGYIDDQGVKLHERIAALENPKLEVLENYREKLITLSGTTTAIDLSLANVFTHTLSGNTTYSITNAVSEQAHSFTLIINQTATVRTLTLPASVKWQGGEIPDTSTPNKTYVLTFMTVDGGATWLGMFGGEF